MVAGEAGQDASTLHAMHQHFDLFWGSEAAVSPEPEKFLGIDFALSHLAGLRHARSDAHPLLARAPCWRRSISMRGATDANGAAGAPFDPSWTPIACERLRYMHDQPDKRSPGTLQDMLHEFDRAQHDILVINPYLILVPALRDVLVRKQREGVRVTLVSASLASTAQEFPAVGRAYADELPGLRERRDRGARVSRPREPHDARQAGAHRRPSLLPRQLQLRSAVGARQHGKWPVDGYPRGRAPIRCATAWRSTCAMRAR